MVRLTPLRDGAERLVRFDVDEREELVRTLVGDQLRTAPSPASGDHVVASYFFVLRDTTLAETAKEIAYHATSGTHDIPPGSLLERCTATVAGVEAFTPDQRVGLVHMAFPVEMLAQADGHLSSTDLLHTTAGAVVFDIYEHVDAKLVRLEVPPAVLATFPGPAHGPAGLRRLTGLPDGDPAFGTILKPTAGLTSHDVGEIVGRIAEHDLFVFVKEDENLYPNLPYAPMAERVKHAVAAVEAARERRGDRGLVFAPHVTGPPHEVLATVEAALGAGCGGVMLSETFAGGTVRMVREATRHLAEPPMIYGHNAGIGTRTRAIWREVIDRLARLDGIDFRQTAPVRPGPAFLRPYGQEWVASEQALHEPIGAIRPTTVVRAGALDHGNIGLNLADVEARGLQSAALFLAGSAINSIKGPSGELDPRVGVEGMLQAIDVHRSGVLRGVPAEEHLAALADLARRSGLSSLLASLQQRYPATVR